MAGASLPLSFSTRRFQASAATIHFVEGPPSGPPLVLVHGLSRDWQSFSPLLDGLSSRFHIFALDLRGHGGSSHVAGGYRIPQFAQDVSEFMAALVPPRACLFGHSLGALVALSVAGGSNSGVKALVVGDTMLSPENFRRSLYRPLFEQLYALLLRGGSEKQLAQGIGGISLELPGFAEPVRIEELPQNTPQAISEWAKAAARTDPGVLATMLDESAFQGFDPQLILPRISCPTLLLQGNPELGALLSDEDVERSLALLPAAEHVRFPLLGHALFMQQAKPVLEAVVRFLER